MNKSIKLLVLSGVLSFSTVLYAGGFQIWEQDAADLGDYHAGAAAEADAAGVEFYNPAGVTRLKHQEISTGAVIIPVVVTFNGTIDGDSSNPVNDASGNTTSLVPNFHYVLPLGHQLWFSFGETTPFGLSTNYDSHANVSTLATETKLQTINLNPALAYQVNRYVSVGAGFDALRGSAIYDLNAYTVYPMSTDLSAWGYGYNLGVLVQFTPNTRLGLSYRSGITLNASGDSTAAGMLGGTVNTTASATFPLPPTTILSLYHAFNPAFSLMASTFYTQWSCFNELVLNNIATPDGPGTIAIFENYANTWNFALGGKYHFNRYLGLEGGFGYDNTPTRYGYRDIRLPDNNRFAASLGLNIYPKPGVIWSMGYTHFFVPSTPINNSQSNDASRTTPGDEPAVSVGSETGDINVIGTQISFVI